MADKTKTIKGATDKELEELVARLRKEGELQRLISDLKRNSADGYIPYDQGLGISTEAPIESLYHVGILGMKWGRKKGKIKKTIPTSQEHKTKEILKKKKLSEMTNAELKTLNERLQLERSYKDLRKSQSSVGKKFVMDLLGSAVKQVAQTYIQKHSVDLLKKFIK
jgi:hypothetical protein